MSQFVLKFKIYSRKPLPEQICGRWPRRSDLSSRNYHGTISQMSSHRLIVNILRMIRLRKKQPALGQQPKQL